MPPRLEAELSKLDPSVPFRASKSHLHHTWAQTFHSYPEFYICPESLPEIQKLVTLARRCRRRLVVVGCGHSPSDLTCTSSWMVNLDKYNGVVSVDEVKRTMVVQAGIRLYQLNGRAKNYGLTLPSLGSIDQQSIAGAIATATHGSSMRHGLLSSSIISLRIVLANSHVVTCSATQNPSLFRAALVSLGALGIIVEITLQMAPDASIEWQQTLHPLSYILDTWSTSLWTSSEYVRVWWLPYTRRAIVWQADRTEKPPRPPKSSWYGGSIGFHTYHVLLWVANYVPSLLPWIERFVFGMQYGFRLGSATSGIEPQRSGLLMDCLYSQFVNEWAIPLHKGPEVLERFGAWLNGDEKASRIPFSSRGLYIHAPIEVRVGDTSKQEPRPYLDFTVQNGPTLFLNATLYRPYHLDPPCRERYYEAFEWLMKEMGGRPHWAKNFQAVSRGDLEAMYGDGLDEWRKVRQDADPDGVFVGEWHRKYVIEADAPPMLCEEHEVGRRSRQGGGILSGYKRRGGMDWFGERAGRPKSESSEESFDVMQGAEASGVLSPMG